MVGGKRMDTDASKIRIQELFQKEIAQNRKYIKFEINESIRKINLAIGEISTLPFDDISVELTPDSTIFFNLRYLSSKIHLELYLDPGIKSSENTFLSIYRKKECRVLWSGNIQKMVILIRNHIEFIKN